MPFVLRRFLAALLLVSLSTLSLSAQQIKRNPEEQPRKVKQELYSNRAVTKLTSSCATPNQARQDSGKLDL